MDTGRVIHRRYLLQHVLERGMACAVYQAFDQVLQRTVVIKVVPVEYIPTYRAAIRVTAQFSHPNITGLFDVIMEPEILYIVQEYVKGDNFGTILRSNPTAYDVGDMGIQLCQALIYTGTASRKVCHGDLTPSSIMRDERGHIHINNFALPSDPQYFTTWSTVGSGGFVLSDPELPYGQLSDGRRGDDTRAVGLLLYQLLAGRPTDAAIVDPSADGRLRFQRNVPPELCEVIARAIVRVHPQRILTAESLYAELKNIVEALESEPVVSTFPVEDVTRLQQFTPAQTPASQWGAATQTGNLVSILPARDVMYEAAPAPVDDISRTTADAPYVAIASAPAAVSDMSMKLAAARQAAYSNIPDTEAQRRKINIPAIIIMGVILFAIFFGVGFFIAHAILP